MTEETGKTLMSPKEFYRERIIKMVEQISSQDILFSISVFVSDIMKEDGENITYKLYSPQNDRARVAKNNSLPSDSY